MFRGKKTDKYWASLSWDEQRLFFEENRSIRELREKDLALPKLKEYIDEVLQKGMHGEFDLTGYKFSWLTDSVIAASDGRKYQVPENVAKAYKKGIAALQTPSGLEEEKEIPFPTTALVEFIAIMKHAAERNHTGRAPATQVFYASFAGEKGEGKTIFPHDPDLAAEFDLAVQLELVALRAKFLSKNQGEFTTILAKLHLAATEQEFEDYQENMQTDGANMAKLQDIISKFKTPENENDPHCIEGSKLLSDTLMRMLFTFIKKDLERYKEDFIIVLRATYPGRVTQEDEAMIEAFFEHHKKMMTSLDKRFMKLYLDAAVNALSLAAGPFVGATVPIPSEITGIVATVTSDMGNVGNLAGSATSRAVELGSEVKLGKFATSTPIIPVSRPETDSEKFLRLTSDENKKKMALLVTTIIMGVAFGPVGAVVVGVGGGALLYGHKFSGVHLELNKIDGMAKAEREAHEEQFCKFCDKILKDQTPDLTQARLFNTLEKERLMRLPPEMRLAQLWEEIEKAGLTDEGMQIRLHNEIVKILGNSEKRIKQGFQAYLDKLRQEMVSGSTASVFVHLEQKQTDFTDVNKPLALNKGLNILREEKLWKPENRDALEQNSEYIGELVYGLETLAGADILDQVSFEALTKNAKYAYHLSEVLRALAKIELLSQQDVDPVTMHGFSEEFGLTTLDSNAAALDHQRNFSTLIKNAAYASPLSDALEILAKASLLIPKNFNGLLDNITSACSIADVFSVLANAKPTLLIQDNIDALLKNAKHGNKIAEGLKTLSNASLLTQENVHSLTKNAKSAEREDKIGQSIVDQKQVSRESKKIHRF
jgi:hypothetical protein